MTPVSIANPAISVTVADPLSQLSPNKAYSTIYTMIVDSKEDNVAFFRKSFLQNQEPIDTSVLSKQYFKIFENYFL